MLLPSMVQTQDGKSREQYLYLSEWLFVVSLLLLFNESHTVPSCDFSILSMYVMQGLAFWDLMQKGRVGPQGQ